MTRSEQAKLRTPIKTCVSRGGFDRGFYDCTTRSSSAGSEINHVGS